MAVGWVSFWVVQIPIGEPTPLDNVRSIIIFVVNSLSTPSTNWNESENPPKHRRDSKSAGVPIDRYSGEMVEQSRDIDARWNALRQIRGLVGVAKEKNPALAEIVNVPYADIYLVDGSFKALLLLGSDSNRCVRPHVEYKPPRLIAQ